MIFRTVDDGRYVGTAPEYGIELHCDHVRRDRWGELTGTVTVVCGMLGTRAIDGPLLSASFQFENLRTRDEWAKRLAQRARTNGKLDWFGLLEQLSHEVIAAERHGTVPAVILRNVAARPAAAMFDVLGIRLPKEHPASLFGPGDGLKSYLSLYIANQLAREGVRVGFFDWELDKHEHRSRQARIDPELPDIHYIKCEQPLVHDVDRLRRIGRSERLEYGFFDSAAYGADGKPEDAIAAMAYFRALRQLGIGTTIIAHSRREEGEQQPFGSVFWHNSFRATWNVKRAATSPSGDVVSLGVFPRKFNLGARPPAVGLTVHFDGDRVYFERTDVASIDELAESLPIWQRMRAAVRTGPMTLAQLAEELNYNNVETLRREAARRKEIFTRVSGPDGVHRIALVERQAS
jgi:hypothetical protein